MAQSILKSRDEKREPKDLSMIADVPEKHAVLTGTRTKGRTISPRALENFPAAIARWTRDYVDVPEYAKREPA
jgi:hypothetical protein